MRAGKPLRSRVAWTTQHNVPAPGHRTGLRGDARREQILDCALAVFARQGFHETSIAAICAQAGIARGTLYQYFADKRAVLAALIERIAGRIVEAVQHWPGSNCPLTGSGRRSTTSP
jgi:AcrR family transcriptional regulator